MHKNREPDKNIDILELIKYILKNINSEYSIDQMILSKIIYLCDWKHTIETGNQITKLKWLNNGFGVSCNYDFKIAINYLCRNDDYLKISIPESYISTIDFVLEKTKKFKYTDFAHLVSSTYPLIVMDKYIEFNLIELAIEYKNYKEKINVR